MGNTARGRYQTCNGIVRFKNQKLKNNNDVIFKIEVFHHLKNMWHFLVFLNNYYYCL